MSNCTHGFLCPPNSDNSLYSTSLLSIYNKNSLFLKHLHWELTIWVRWSDRWRGACVDLPFATLLKDCRRGVAYSYFGQWCPLLTLHPRRTPYSIQLAQSPKSSLSTLVWKVAPMSFCTLKERQWSVSLSFRCAVNQNHSFSPNFQTLKVVSLFHLINATKCVCF